MVLFPTFLFLLLLAVVGPVFSFNVGTGTNQIFRPTARLSATTGADARSTSTSVGINLETETFRETSFRIAWSFDARPFNPLPVLSNCHFQTISGVFLRNDPDSRYATSETNIFQKAIQLISSVMGEADINGEFWDERQRIATPDGDFFHVDNKYHGDDGDPSSKGLGIVLHGRQSSSNSSLSVDLGKAYRKLGFDVACVNFRGCSGVPNNKLRAYHLGFTDDLKHYLSLVNNSAQKTPPIFISGFSLGANVVLKTLGELGSSAFEDYNVYGAAVAGAPFDNERNVNFVQKDGFNKLAYNNNLLNSLKKTALSQIERMPDSDEAKLLDKGRIAQTTLISAFETAVIAPLFGFEDNVDYYRKTNCINFLDEIQVPTLIMNAADDPFFDPDYFPTEFSCSSPEGERKRMPISMVRTEHGGHLGYMFHQRGNDESDMEDTSFMPTQLALFIRHVFERRSSLEKAAAAMD